MENKRKCCCKTKETEVKPQDLYAGAAVDTADANKTTKEMVKERTATLNNNPRNKDIER